VQQAADSSDAGLVALRSCNGQCGNTPTPHLFLRFSNPGFYVDLVLSSLIRIFTRLLKIIKPACCCRRRHSAIVPELFTYPLSIALQVCSSPACYSVVAEIERIYFVPIA
jgi:hypothetical protein